MNTYYNTIKDILVEAGFTIKKINDTWGLYSDGDSGTLEVVVETRTLGDLLSEAEKQLGLDE